MILCRSKDTLAQEIQKLKEQGQSIAFVPTMGALHEGHLSLARLAQEHADVVAVSIFVNPTQFAPDEDFDAYPRDADADLEKLQEIGANLVYLPRVEDLYPDGAAATLKTGEAAKGLESDFRPHFFDGVVTVVKRLFDQVQPDTAIFGEKDFQQLQVIREMVEHEGLGTKIIGAPIARDEYGLALSSRNAYLSEGELEIARMFNQVLYKAVHDIGAGIDQKSALEEAKNTILTCGFDKIDYVSVRDSRVLAAAWLGRTRLIDNAPIATP